MTHGVLVVDKPRGPTSHDVVAWARRALGTRAVGHAGTLDPMATGVLVLGIGEGTKLTPYLMSEDKGYETTIVLGAETDTLDAEGRVTSEHDVPALDRARVEAACARFVGTYLQRAPAVSAIKKDGVALHERVRRGEDVEAPEREVRCDAIDVLDVRAREIDLRVRCGKGFYVRSLGRDLARALGTGGHLGVLRRTRSGAFSVDDALSGELLQRARGGDEDARAQVRASLRSLEGALSTITRLDVGVSGARELRHGRAFRIEEPAVREPIAALDEAGELVAIVRWNEGALRVVRGFAPRTKSAEDAT
ncbi:tRNA pseudouridine(55) synthase TruB [Sandaracinus amylolyticus]|uniref:tRNA pseudouridine(55) synthase TruB n=1 Tax=Sandaracinus amylolyticus TaxID=927083 RepID=UPI001F02FCA2|nr:tRNA pseudouridine(55) synthase TruB [Sandaracinus amylolyticus]UJR81133.1 tRNA pseudouridine synthase B [Sandaracinus amylolyticus]